MAAARAAPRARAGGARAPAARGRAGRAAAPRRLRPACATPVVLLADDAEVAFTRIRNGKLVNVYIVEADVELKRPLGMVLASRPNGKGVFVDELVEGGNAESSQLVLPGDVLLGCAPGGDGVERELTACGEMDFDGVMELLTQAPDAPSMRLRLQREQDEEQEEDELTPEERERRYRQEYFEEQRLKREERWKSGQTTNTLGHPSSAIRVEQGKVLGEGSFGQVLEGTLTTEEGEVAVVLKRAKEGVFGAEELLTSELKLSGKALEVSGGRTAAFMGAVEVGYAEEGQIYDGVLSTGMWGVWRLEGRTSLQFALARASKDPSTRPLSKELAEMGMAGAAGGEAAAVAEVMRPLLSVLADLHEVGLVHRDLKPDNMIYAEGDAVFKLIDFGASALCLGTAINHEPGDGPHDPKYCGLGETNLLPEEAFIFDGLNKMSYELSEEELQSVWERFEPQLFDVYSAGIILMQLAVPALHSGEGLDAFREELAACDFDLDAWRERHMGAAPYAEHGAPALDADGGKYWQAARAMLRPRGERASVAEALAFF